MKSKILAFFLSIKKTWIHLVITLIFGVIIFCITYFTNLDQNILNLLIGILSGLIASFLLAHCEVYRVNILAKNKIINIITIFCGNITNSLTSSKFDLNENYKLYVDLLTCSPDLTYKSNFDKISDYVGLIIGNIRDSDINSVQSNLDSLQTNIENFYN
ncbi:MAG: hypothetical protein HFK06_01665 [Clostridia bacterium]|nr:hypothetical protein [Clostridia bacterium]